MSQAATLHVSEESGRWFGASKAKAAMWIFLISDACTFVMLLAAYGYLRFVNSSWPVASKILNIPLTGVNTLILAFSSVSMLKALHAVRRGDQKALSKFLIFTITGGAIFLVIQAFEWHHLITVEGMSLHKDLFSACFFSITGFHGFHVTCGVIYLSVILAKALQGRYTAENNMAVDLAGMYWHFVDGIWIMVFLFIYLI